MKRYFALFLAALALFCSCGKRGGETTTAVTTEPVTTPVVATADSDEPQAPAVPDIELVSRTENISSAAGSTKTFVYPKITLADNTELADRINMEIEAVCHNVFKRSVPGAASMVNGGAEIVYKTTACNYYLHNGKYLSVEFFITIDVFGGVTDEMPSRVYSALNIDLENGEVYYPEKLIKDLDKLKNALENGIFTPAEGVELTVHDISEALVQYRSDYGIYPSVYFDGERVTVCVELAKLQGGYALFYLSADRASEYFNDQFIN